MVGLAKHQERIVSGRRLSCWLFDFLEVPSALAVRAAVPAMLSCTKRCLCRLILV